MNKQTEYYPYLGDQDLHEQLRQELSTYPLKIVQKDGLKTIKNVKNSYFLKKDIWNYSFLSSIKNFEQKNNYTVKDKNVCFNFTSPIIKLEVKYVFYHKIFNDEWSLSTLFGGGKKQTI